MATQATDPNQNPPFAGIDAAGNVRIDSAAKIQATRWIPNRNGRLKSYYIKVKSTASDGAPYAGGTGGSMLAQLVRETALAPDLTKVVSSVNVGALATANPSTSQNGVQIDFNCEVYTNTPYWVVITNNDGTPATNYFSQNYGYVTNGMSGANASNQSDGSSPNLYYGLDPRELVAGSGNSGSTWNIPGDAVSGGVLTKHMPTYIAQFTDGWMQAQPYYSATTPSNGSYTQVYQSFPRAWLLSTIFAWSNGAGPSGTAAVDVLIDDVLQESVTLSGTGFLRASLVTIRNVPRTSVLKLTTTVNSAGGGAGLPLQEHYADSYFEGILGLGSSYKWYELGNVARSIPLMPLGSYDLFTYAPTLVPAFVRRWT